MLVPKIAHRCEYRLIFISLALIICGVVVLAATSEEEILPLEPWQDCDIFLAPSTTGWGVFAARDFVEGEHVDTSTLSVPTSDERHNGIPKSSVLNDYVYGYNRYDREYSTIVLHGSSMFFNHHPEPNVQYYKVGSGPIHAMGFHARRGIRAGEQLYSTYGDEDGGVQWFKDRNMVMVAPEESVISSENLPYFTKEFCSKIHAGFGRPFVERLKEAGDNVPVGVDPTRLAPFDAGIGDARAKQSLSKGERIEIGSGLILSTKLIAGSVFGGIVFSWQHLKEEHRANLRILRETGQLKLQHQGYDTGWNSIDTFESYEDLSILPASGHIGVVRRVGETEPSNCRLDILWQLGQKDGVSVTLQLRATRDINAGEVLLLNLPPAGTKEELRLLQAELDGIEEPYFSGLFDTKNDPDLESSHVEL